MAEYIAPFPLPDISEADLFGFHTSHFSANSLQHFGTHFLGPVADTGVEEEDDDGLGYYPDGVKRTLTDEQIAIFRHSEIQALLRERRHAEENKKSHDRSDAKTAEVEDGELEESEPILAASSGQATESAQAPDSQNETKGKRKSQKPEQKKRGYKQNAKPDLRKRTWDRVDRGLESLDYGQEENGATTTPAASQRRRISYEDV